MLDAQKIIEMFDLKPLPQEGGFYKESYRSDDKILKQALPERYSGDKNFGTAIYYLLTPETKSLMHRLTSDEIFHFYLGDSVEMLQLFPDSSGKIITLGSNITQGHLVQVLVPNATWQGMRLRPGGSHALMGTTMAPGFNFDDFELGSRRNLVEQYPDFKDQIIKLTN